MALDNKLIPVPFADKAGGNWKYNIQNRKGANEPPNKASYEVGFPSVTMTDIQAGGIPFFGQDVNGVLNHITTAIRYMQAGNFAQWDEDFAKQIGGYSNLAIVSNNGVLYLSKVDNNTAKLNDTNNWELFLNNNTNSTSTTTAATANAVKVVNDIVTKNKNETNESINKINSNTNKLSTEKTSKDDVNNLINNKSLGINQKWQNLTNQRSRDTNYLNNTGKAILLNIVINQTGLNLSTIIVDGVTYNVSGNISGTAERPFTFIIGVGSTYRLPHNFFSWNEYR